MAEALVELEPVQSRNRFATHDRSMQQLKRAEISNLMGSETLILATAVGRVVLEGLAWQEKRKLQKLLLYIAGVTVILIGLACLAVQFVKS